MKEKKILVAVTNYPKEDNTVIHKFVHVRNKYYKQNGIDVTVLNFTTNDDYVYDDIKVISLNTFKKNLYKDTYSVLVLHQANIRMHYKFLIKYGNFFSKFVFFYHGHEVLKINKVYPPKYEYNKKDDILKYIFQNIYDDFKLLTWRRYLPKIESKSYFVFVSRWMLDEFLKWTKISPEVIQNRYSITYNCVGEVFEKEKYSYNKEKLYDFVTVRGNIDTSKYAIDIVNRLAYNTPEAKFLLIGKGKFFTYNKKAPNLTWIDKNLSHNEIIEFLNISKYALMPTRTDAQGLMMCEMAAFGIPVITSDIPVCHEVFDEFKNAFYINNDDDKESLNKYLYMNIDIEKDCRFFLQNTGNKEVELLNNIITSIEEEV